MQATVALFALSLRFLNAHKPSQRNERKHVNVLSNARTYRIPRLTDQVLDNQILPQLP